MNKVYVYGTLRPGSLGTSPKTLTGYKMLNLGWFPGVVESDNEDDTIVVQEVTVDDSQLEKFDHYEGYDENDPEGSLYVRKKLSDSRFIYIYNSATGCESAVESGDWLLHTGEKAGSAAYVEEENVY